MFYKQFKIWVFVFTILLFKKKKITIRCENKLKSVDNT